MLLDKRAASAIDHHTVPCDASAVVPFQNDPLESALASEQLAEAATEIVGGCTYHRWRHNSMIAGARRDWWPSLLDSCCRASMARLIDLAGQEQMAAAIRQMSTNDCSWQLSIFQDT